MIYAWIHVTLYTSSVTYDLISVVDSCSVSSLKSSSLMNPRRGEVWHPVRWPKGNKGRIQMTRTGSLTSWVGLTSSWLNYHHQWGLFSLILLHRHHTVREAVEKPTSLPTEDPWARSPADPCAQMTMSMWVTFQTKAHRTHWTHNNNRDTRDYKSFVWAYVCEDRFLKQFTFKSGKTFGFTLDSLANFCTDALWYTW